MHPYRRLRVAMASAPGTAACAACRVLRRKCTAQCLFAPYFPPDQPQKFAHVHKVFGVANVTKMLHDLPPPHREDCVNSLAYEADARVQDPVYGCVGAISVLQQQVAHLQAQLSLATSEIARLRETFAIAAAASTHNNSNININNNGNSNTNTSNGTNTIPSSNNAIITNGNGNAATGGGALFMAALEPTSRSSSPHCLAANGISNNNHASALTAAAIDQDSPQGLLLRSKSHNEHNNSNNNTTTMNCSSMDNNNNNHSHSHNHNHNHSHSQNNNHAHNDITQSVITNKNMIENEITLVNTSSR